MPPFIKGLVIALVCVLVSVCFGFWLATEDYFYFILLAIISLTTITVLVPGYAFLLAFGLLCPFVIPLPFVYSFPFVAIMLGLASLKYILRGSLNKPVATLQHYVSLPIAIFFGWVLFRYCLDPAKPGIALGMGEGVTGFRAYMTYLLSFILFCSFKFFFENRNQVVKLVHWLGIVSFAFVVLLAPLVLTKSLGVAEVLSRFGMFVTFFDNGWLRFVALPEFGGILLILSFLPRLAPASRNVRVVCFLSGLVAIIMGGNRSSVVMAFAMVLVIALARRRIALFAGASVMIGCSLVAFNYIGENLLSSEKVGFFRIVSLVSGRAAEMTNASNNVTWRKVRWERALQDVYEHPFIGMSYGGLERAFISASAHEFEQARVEIDVAAGTIHNGYIAVSRALGVPACLLFIYIICRQILFHGRQAMRFRDRDSLQCDLHCFVVAQLVALTIHAYIGLDLNSVRIWFFLGLGVLVARMQDNRGQAQVPARPITLRPVHV